MSLKIRFSYFCGVLVYTNDQCPALALFFGLVEDIYFCKVLICQEYTNDKPIEFPTHHVSNPSRFPNRVISTYSSVLFSITVLFVVFFFGKGILGIQTVLILLWITTIVVLIFFSYFHSFVCISFVF